MRRGDRDKIQLLGDGLENIVQMLAMFPAAGVCIAERGPLTLRKLLFRKGPYLVWYLCDPRDDDGWIWLLRLFHARQRRPVPRIRLVRR